MRRNTPVNVQMNSWGVAVFESHHAWPFFMEMTKSPYLQILYVLQGEGQMITGEQTIGFASGDVLAVPPKQTYRLEDRQGKQVSLYGVCIDPSLYAFDPGFTLPLGRLPYQKLLSREVRPLLQSLLLEQTQGFAGRPLAMVSQALGLLSLLAKSIDAPKSSADPFSKGGEAVQKYLADLPRTFNRETTIEAAASRLGLSKRRFTELIKMQTGQTWLALVTKYKLGYAKKLLAQTGRSVVSIAFESGFADLANFYRVFKKSEGVTPGTFRDRC